MDSGTVFYIIAVIIYFIYTAFQQRKAKNKEVEGESHADPPSSEAPAKGSFDDILREIRRQQEERERDIVIAREKPKDTPQSKTEIEPTFEEQEIRQTAYSPKKQDSTYIDPYRSLSQPLIKLDDQVDIHEDVKILGQVESSVDNQTGNPYAKLLKNPNTLADAVVVSEILERKHF